MRRWRKNALWLFLLIVSSMVTATPNINVVKAHPTKVECESKIDTGLTEGKQFTINITVDTVTSLWGYQFELSFNPDVIHGVGVEDGDFLGSEGGFPWFTPGSWNNTLGKLSLTTCFLWETERIYCPNGTGVLAIVTFEVVRLGETELRLDEETGLKDWTGGWIIRGRDYVEDGYFRNIAEGSIPTASFTPTPVGTPPAQGPLEGYYTRFDGTPSSGGTPPYTYKWYFWKTLHEELDDKMVTSIVTGSVVDHNYSRWYDAELKKWFGVGRGTWPVSLTVIDDNNVVGTTTLDVTVKAHDVFFAGIKTNATLSKYPSGLSVDIGKVLKVEVTAKNEGNFTQTFDVSCFWGVYYAGEYQYGALNDSIANPVTVTDLSPGDNTILTFRWYTEGRNLTHPDQFSIHANASAVDYEFDKERETGKIADNEYVKGPFRVRFHDIRVKGITTTYVNCWGEVLVVVVNDGDYNETSITVTLYNNTDVIDTKVIDYMENRTYGDYPRPKTWEVTLKFYWNTTGMTPGLYTIKADATVVPGDYEPHDNTDTKTVYVVIPADIEGDRDVDGDDFYRLAWSYGSAEGEYWYRSYADIDCNKAVDGDDFYILAKNYGKSV